MRLEVRFLQAVFDSAVIRIPLEDGSSELVFDHPASEVRLQGQRLVRYADIGSVSDTSTRDADGRTVRVETSVTLTVRGRKGLVLVGEALETRHGADEDDALWSLWTENRDRLVGFLAHARRVHGTQGHRRPTRAHPSFASFGRSGTASSRAIVAGCALAVTGIALYLLWRRLR